MLNTEFVKYCKHAGVYESSATAFEHHLDDKHPCGISASKLVQIFRIIEQKARLDASEARRDLLLKILELERKICDLEATPRCFQH